MGRRKGKRNRERQARPVVQRAEWWYRGRAVVVVEVTSKGPLVTCRVPAYRVREADRERAAHWLGEYLPRLTHDERFALLWS